VYVRLTMLLVMTCCLLPCYFLLRLFARTPQARYALGARWSQYWFRAILKIFNWRVTMIGEPPPPGCMLAPNHIGYGDILALSALTGCFFVSKSDVLKWPVIGPLMASTEHLTVSREVSRDLAATGRLIASRLEHGHRVCVFLEGTTTSGDRVLRFIPSLVQPAVLAKAPIVPTGIRWSTPVQGVDRGEEIAYWKDHTLGPHVMNLIAYRTMHVEVTFSKAVPTDGANRKDLARSLRAEVVRLVRPELETEEPSDETSWRGGVGGKTPQESSRTVSS
jgi:1-acyl-sn-glycerol-3-phosphate acyltransferase